MNNSEKLSKKQSSNGNYYTMQGQYSDKAQPFIIPEVAETTDNASFSNLKLICVSAFGGGLTMAFVVVIAGANLPQPFNLLPNLAFVCILLFCFASIAWLLLQIYHWQVEWLDKREAQRSSAGPRNFAESNDRLMQNSISTINGNTIVRPTGNRPVITSNNTNTQNSKPSTYQQQAKLSNTTSQQPQSQSLVQNREVNGEESTDGSKSQMDLFLITRRNGEENETTWDKVRENEKGLNKALKGSDNGNNNRLLESKMPNSKLS